MQPRFRPAFLVPFLLSALLLAAAAEEKTTPAPADSQERQAATRLQVFLDRAGFGPGKIDGHYGGFTEKALALYRQAHGKDPLPKTEDTQPPDDKPDPTEKPKEKTKEEKTDKDKDKEEDHKKDNKTTSTPLPDLQDLDLASVDPVFIEYQVTEADVKMVGDLPKEIPAKAELKWLPYATLAEAIAEKFHSDLDYLEELNPGKLAALKAGDTLQVPNVEPFDMNAVKDMPLLDLADKDKKDSKAKEESPDKDDDKALKPDQISVTVESSDSMLHLHEKGKLVAAYPVTIGSAQTESPQGEWKVKGIARLPDFRYDRSFLKTGERSNKTHLLQPGPNNPVGAVWIALNKSGIGLHGTDDPDSIGRSASHGCVRLANWDIARLASRLRAGVKVTIR